MKKGFTLIELLAVIVILAIIALIATPIILGIINDAREQSKHRTAELIAKEVELAYTSYLFKGNGVGDVDNFCSYMNGNFDMDNATVTSCNDKTATVKSGNDYYGILYEDGIAKIYYLSEEGSTDMDSPYAQVTLKGSSDSSGNFVYMWYEGENVDGPSLNEVINPSDYAQTLPSGQNYCLKFKLDKTNKVTEGYACAIYNGTTYCVQGWNPDYYGYTGPKNPEDGEELTESEILSSTGNIAILNSTKKANLSYFCAFYSYYSHCSADSVDFSADSDGMVNANDGDGICSVYGDGSSVCESL